MSVELSVNIFYGNEISQLDGELFEEYDIAPYETFYNEPLDTSYIGIRLCNIIESEVLLGIEKLNISDVILQYINNVEIVISKMSEITDNQRNILSLALSNLENRGIYVSTDYI